MCGGRGTQGGVCGVRVGGRTGEEEEGKESERRRSGLREPCRSHARVRIFFFFFFPFIFLADELPGKLRR